MAFKIKKSLASRIAFYILIASIILFTVSLSVFYYFSKKSIEEMTFENAKQLTQKTAYKTEQVLLTSEKIIKNYKWLLEKNSLNPDSIYTYTKLIVKNNPEFLGCAIAFEPNYFKEEGYYFSPYTHHANGKLCTTQLGSPNYEYYVMDWYQIPAATGKEYWTEPYFDTGGAESLITTYSLPFYQTVNGEKTLAGVITIDLSLEWLTEIVSSVSILETGYASVLSHNGTFVTHPNNDLIMHQTIFSYAVEMHNPKIRDIGRKMLKGETGSTSVKINNLQWVVFYTSLKASGWSLAVLFPKSEMYAPLKKISIILIILILVGLSLLIFVISRVVSSLISPLRDFAKSAGEIAEGNFNTKLPSIETEDEMKDLNDAFSHMQNDLNKYIENLKTATSAKEKIESELRIAREIQMGMVPKIFPPFPDIKEIDIFAMLEPAKEVGGDLYDFFMIDETHLCFAIGDVSGKGVPASLFMAVTRTLLRSVAPKQLSTKVIVESLNKSLALGNESNMFVTFFIGIINLETGKIKYTNAGHNPPAIINETGDVRLFEITKNIPIGLFDDFDYDEKECILSVNDRLFLYTDGITEAENWNEELYSEERLVNCLSVVNSYEPSEIVMQVARDVVIHVNDYLQSDDLTMMCIVYYGK